MANGPENVSNLAPQHAPIRWKDVRKELYELIALHVNEVNRLGFAKEFFGEHGVQPLPVAGVSEETAQNSFVAVGAPL